MKHLALIILLLALLSELQLAAQLTDRESMGAYSGGGMMPTPAQSAAFERNQLEATYRFVTNRYGGKIYANINGKICNMMTSGKWVLGTVYSLQDGILYLGDGRNFLAKAVKNYSGSEVTGQSISLFAVRDGNYDYGGRIVELWDCGKPLTPEQAKRQQIEDDKALAAIENAKTDKAKAEQVKADAAKVASVKWNQEQADKGDSYGLLRMGERYRDGDGVEKDLAKAQEYLSKASAAGSSSATDALEKLKPGSTNSPTAQ